MTYANGNGVNGKHHSNTVPHTVHGTSTLLSQFIASTKELQNYKYAF